MTTCLLPRLLERDGRLASAYARGPRASRGLVAVVSRAVFSEADGSADRASTCWRSCAPTGRRISPAGRTSPTGTGDGDAETFAEEFTAAMDCRGRLLAQALAKHLALGTDSALLDIAGGSASTRCSLAARVPGLPRVGPRKAAGRPDRRARDRDAAASASVVRHRWRHARPTRCPPATTCTCFRTCCTTGTSTSCGSCCTRRRALPPGRPDHRS